MEGPQRALLLFWVVVGPVEGKISKARRDRSQALPMMWKSGLVLQSSSRGALTGI